MDLYPTAETWSGTPGAIAPADGNAGAAVAAVFRPPVLGANGAEASDRSDPSSKEGGYNRAAPGASATIDLGPNNERLEDLKPKLVHALRGDRKSVV